MISFLLQMFGQPDQDPPKHCENCEQCSCSKSTPATESMFDLECFEADPSPLATQTIKFFNELEAEKAAAGQDFWERFCELDSSAPECKTYDV